MDLNLDRLQPGRRIVAGAPEGYDAVLLARLAAQAGTSGLLHIVRDHRRLVRVRRALAFFAPELEVVPLVTWDCSPYDRRSPSSAVSARRIDALLKLGQPSDGPRLVLTTTHAFLRRLPPQGMLETSAFHAGLGDNIEEPLRHFLLRNGYSPANSVRTPGDFLWDDDRVDIFAPGSFGRLRLDLLNGTLNAIHRGEDAELERLELPPMSEVVLNDASMTQFQANYQEQFGRPEGHDPLFEAVGQGRRLAGMEHWLPLFYGRTETLCEYLPGCPVSLDEGAEAERDDYLDQIADAFQARKAMGSIEEKAKLPVFRPLPPEQVFIDAVAWDDCLSPRAVTVFQAAPPETNPKAGSAMEDAGARPGPRFHGDDGADALKAHLERLRGEDARVLFAVERDAQHGPMKRRIGMPDLPSADTWDDVDGWAVATLPVEAGFQAPDFHVIARADIVKPEGGKRRDMTSGDLPDVIPIALGDLVVHAEHGVGLCEGLEAVDVGGAPHDCVRLIYQQGDKLFVPVENMDLLWRFGAPGETIQLDKLGGNAWPNRLERVRETMREAARELVATAAKREIAKVEPIVPPRAEYRRFTARFPYTETDDQQSAIDDVLADLASGKVMDRLVVGDVDFGKTEVALRAAFAVASSGRQVAVVAPTTPLARQHADEFRERFSGFGYEMAELSRVASPAEAKEARKRIADQRSPDRYRDSGGAQRSRDLQGSWSYWCWTRNSALA